MNNIHHYVLDFDDEVTYEMYNIHWSASDNVTRLFLTVYSNIGTLCVL